MTRRRSSPSASRPVLPRARAAPPALLREAVQHHQAGRLAEAEALYQRVLAETPRQPDVYSG